MQHLTSLLSASSGEHAGVAGHLRTMSKLTRPGAAEFHESALHSDRDLGHHPFEIGTRSALGIAASIRGIHGLHSNTVSKLGLLMRQPVCTASALHPVHGQRRRLSFRTCSSCRCRQGVSARTPFGVWAPPAFGWCSCSVSLTPGSLRSPWRSLAYVLANLSGYLISLQQKSRLHCVCVPVLWRSAIRVRGTGMLCPATVDVRLLVEDGALPLAEFALCALALDALEVLVRQRLFGRHAL